MSHRSDIELLIDIKISLERILIYTKDLSFDDFMSSQITVDAVVRNFGIIGEAANRVDNHFKLKNHNIEWRRIIGLRNRVIHEYFGIDLVILWSIVNESIPNFLIEIESVINMYNS